MSFRLTTLGTIDLRGAGGEPVASLLAQPKRLALLIFLASMPRGAYCRRDTLLALFWPESDQERGRASLRRSLHFLRRALGEGAIRTRGEDVGLDPGAVEADLAELYAASASGNREEAVLLHAGEFLPGFHVESAPDFQEWITTQRAQLQALALEAAESLARGAAADGRTGEAVRWARRAVEIAPDEERVVRLLMEVLAASGDRSGALDVYRALESRLAARYGDSPSARTEALASELRAADDLPGAPAAAGPPQGHPMPPSPARWRRAAALLLILAAGLGAAWIWSTRRTADEGEIRVAILPFAVSSQGAHAYLEAGLPVLLSTRLHEAGPLSAIDPSAVLEAWEREPARSRGNGVVALGRRLNATLVVVGRVVATGDSVRVSADLWEMGTGARVARTETTGTERELHGIADRVATRLLADYLREHGDAWAATAARTTTSPAALKAWLEGEGHLRRGRYRPAVQAFQAATGADSTFALAHYRLAVAADWAGQGLLVGTAAERAVALKERLGPQEQTLVEALLAAYRGRSPAAERLYRQAATSRPSDVEAWLGLGELLFHRNPAVGRSMEEARPAFEQVLRLDPGNFPALAHLARLAALRADLPVLDRLTRTALQTDPDGGHRAEMLLLRAVALGDRDAASAVSTLPVSPVMLDALWRTAGYTENPAKVEAQAKLLLRATGDPELRASLHLLLAHLAAAQGCAQGTAAYADSLSAVAPAAGAMTRMLFSLPPHGFEFPEQDLAVPPASGRAVYTGRMEPDGVSLFRVILPAATSLHMGNPDAAHAEVAGAAAIQNAHATWGRAYLIARLARGPSLEVALGDIARADSFTADNFAPSSPYFPRALSHLAVAGLLQAAGRPDEALARLGGVPEDLGFGVAYRAAVHHRKAALLRAAGDSQGAARETAMVRRIWLGCRR